MNVVFHPADPDLEVSEMSTATLQSPPKTENPAEKPENGVPVAARPAPAPATPPVDDEELRKEAAAVEQEEETQEGEQEDSEPEEDDDMVGKRLFGAVQEITDEIEECQTKIQKANEAADKQKEEFEKEYQAKLEKVENERSAIVEEAEARAEELKTQTTEWFTKMQSTFGVAPKAVRKQQAAKPVKARQGKNGKSIRALILEYLEKHRSAKTSEIRNFLQAQGRTTNPGVELSRMVKDKSIVNKERGMYTLGKSK